MSLDTFSSTGALPLDVLGLIVEEVKRFDFDFKALRCLRLVCNTMNELAGPIVFRKLTIPEGRKSTAARIQSQLPALAGSSNDNLNPLPSANARWTKELHISRLLPIIPTLQPPWYRDILYGEEEEVVRGVQNTWLAPAIRSLKNVESAYFGITTDTPYLDVLRSLAQLPNLQELHMTLSGTLNFDEQLVIDVFPSNLRILEVDGMAIHPLVLTVLGGWVGKSPSLEELRLHPPIYTYIEAQHPLAGIDRIFEDALKQAPLFVPTLKTLIVTRPGLIFRSTSAPYLQALTHLDILGDHEGLPSFWGALSQAGVQIQHLTIYLSPGLAVLCYLTSYVGLEELHLCGELEDTTPDIPRKLFHEVLPCHRKSLQHLSFKMMSFELWSVTEEYLEGILKCASLRTLALLNLFNPATGALNSVDLSILFSRIAEHLPHLQTLRLQPASQTPPLYPRPSIVTRLQRTANSFRKYIRELDLDGVAFAKQPGFLVEVVWQDFSRLFLCKSALAFDSSRRRFGPLSLEDDSDSADDDSDSADDDSDSGGDDSDSAEEDE